MDMTRARRGIDIPFAFRKLTSISTQNTQISETKEFKKSYFRESDSKADFKSASFSVWCYRGLVEEPKWKDVDTSKYKFSSFRLTY